MLKLLFAASLALAPLASSATEPKTPQCSPPVAVPKSVTTPNATYYNDGEPPARFAHAPTGTLKVQFGQAAIDRVCGPPPCGMRFLGCARGDDVVLLDPFTMQGDDFAKLVRHELAHLSGWPATHGD